MKKTILTILTTTMLSASANAVVLTDHFYKNGYTKPESLSDIQMKIDNGTYYNYPYIAGRSTQGLFEDKLKNGTAIPQIRNVTNLLKALDKDQVVLVADSSGSVHGCLPIFKEIAKQNGTTCDELMNHLTVNSNPDDSDFFNNINDIMDKVNSKIDEITQELNDEISEEVMEEIVTELDMLKEALQGVDLDQVIGIIEDDRWSDNVRDQLANEAGHEKWEYFRDEELS